MDYLNIRVCVLGSDYSGTRKVAEFLHSKYGSAILEVDLII